MRFLSLLFPSEKWYSVQWASLSTTTRSFFYSIWDVFRVGTWVSLPFFLVAQRKREVVTVMERLAGLSTGSHSWKRAWRP